MKYWENESKWKTDKKRIKRKTHVICHFVFAFFFQFAYYVNNQYITSEHHFYIRQWTWLMTKLKELMKFKNENKQN